jgi:hypothetical protein
MDSEDSGADRGRRSKARYRRALRRSRRVFGCQPRCSTEFIRVIVRFRLVDAASFYRLNCILGRC